MYTRRQVLPAGGQSRGVGARRRADGGCLPALTVPSPLPVSYIFISAAARSRGGREEAAGDGESQRDGLNLWSRWEGRSVGWIHLVQAVPPPPLVKVFACVLGWSVVERVAMYERVILIPSMRLLLFVCLHVYPVFPTACVSL